MKIQLLLDDAGRRFRMGEPVSGTVALDLEPDDGFAQGWITYQWRTHGRGTRDQGRGQRLELIEEDAPRFGSSASRLSFRFQSPNGPVTYHGQYINVDWYLTAHVRTRRGRIIKKEEDFLLLPGSSNGPVVLGTKEIAPEDLPVRVPAQTPGFESFGWPMATSSATAPSSPPFIRVLTGIGLGVAILAYAAWIFNLWRLLPGGRATPWLIGVGGLVLLLVILGQIYSHAYTRKLDVKRLEVEPDITYAGNLLKCSVEFAAKREVYLQSIRATIYAQESATSQRGTASVTETRIVTGKTHEKRYEEPLMEGRVISFACSLPVDADEPPSFSAQNNKLDWFAHVRVDLKGWPGVMKTFRLTVLP